MAKRGLMSAINTIAREQAKAQRQREAAQKRLAAAQTRAKREAERASALRNKTDKQRYLEARINETADKNNELAEQIESLKRILKHTLKVNDVITFDSLRIHEKYSPRPIPPILTTRNAAPTKEQFLAKVKPLSFLENTLGRKGRYERDIEAAEEQYAAALKAYEVAENERETRLAEFLTQDKEAEQSFIHETQERNQAVDELEAAYKEGEASAVLTYNSMVLERSEYPEGFPQNFRLAYVPGAKEIVIEYELPNVNIVPAVLEYKYTKSKDEIEPKPRKVTEIKELYQDIVASAALRTIHEVLEADQGEHLAIVTFNGMVTTIDQATGIAITPCLISVRTSREKFTKINLARVDKLVCLQDLGAQLSPRPYEMKPVKPLVDFDAVDKPFVDQGDGGSEAVLNENPDNEPNELTVLADEVAKAEKAVAFHANKVRQLQTLFKSMQYSTQRYFDYDGFSREIVSDNLAAEADEILETTVKLKLHSMDIRELRKLAHQNNKVIRDLLLKYKSRYTTRTNTTIYQLMVIALEAELQNVLYNLSYSKLDKSIQDIKAITAKYQKIASDGNQSIATTVARFIGEIEYLFIEAIKIEYEYYIQKERIKEEQKALREQMRQEAAERKLLEEERKKIENEESKYKSELANIQELMLATEDQLKIQQLEERLAKVQAHLDDVETKKNEIVNLQHGKAGYIYIISNLGSFGENVFKIGMTRRINPQDRIDELGDASVPFRFDIHSFIFSNNASELETNLHRKLKEQRINKVNLRKEFFRATIDEIEELVYSLEPSAEFNRTMLAEQYYQSMSVEEIPDTVNVIDDDDLAEDEE